MPRFYFDVLDGRCAADEIGTVCADERSARREAIRRSAVLLRVMQSRDQRKGSADWAIKVRDEAGNTVFQIDTLPSEESSA